MNRKQSTLTQEFINAGCGSWTTITRRLFHFLNSILHPLFTFKNRSSVLISHFTKKHRLEKGPVLSPVSGIDRLVTVSVATVPLSIPTGRTWRSPGRCTRFVRKAKRNRMYFRIDCNRPSVPYVKTNEDRDERICEKGLMSAEDKSGSFSRGTEETMSDPVVKRTSTTSRRPELRVGGRCMLRFGSLLQPSGVSAIRSLGEGVVFC